MDAASFARLVQDHAGRLVLYARQRCDAPEDAVQEAFLRLARQRVPPDDPLAWLYRTVRNVALDLAKAHRRRERRESTAARQDWFVQAETEGLDAEAAVKALERLPAEQREVIVARLWGGLGFEQVGAAVGCSASTAFRRHEAGIEALRRLLGEPCSTNCPN